MKKVRTNSMKSNKRFYERYKIEQKEMQKEKKLRKKYGIPDEKIVVIENKTKVDKAISYVSRIINIILKIIIYTTVFGLSSIGATVMLNETLRENFFELLMLVI